jgi:hypothetical protein
VIESIRMDVKNGNHSIAAVTPDGAGS